MAHTFPPLPAEDISACLSELGATFPVEYLKNPNPKDVRQLFEKLAEQCLGVSHDEFQMPFDVLERLDHAELHEKSFSIRILFNYMKKLAKAACVKDFSMNDMVSPDAKRLCYILSGIINFEKYRADKIPLFDSSVQNLDGLAVIRVEAETRANINEQKLNDLKMQVEREMPEAQKLHASNNKTQQNINSLRNEYNGLFTQYSDASSKLESSQLRLDQARNQLDNVLSNVATTKEKILPSTDELRKILNEQSRQVDIYKRENVALSQITREWQPRMDYLDKLSGSLNKKIGTMDELQNELIRIKKFSKDLQEHQENYRDSETKIKEIEAQEEHLKSQISELYDKSTRQKKQFENKKKKAQMALEEVELQRMQLQQELEQIKLSQNRTDSENARKQQEIAKVREQSEKDFSMVKHAQEKLTEQVQHYHMALKEAAN